jgi:hypothetical protein
MTEFARTLPAMLATTVLLAGGQYCLKFAVMKVADAGASISAAGLVSQLWRLFGTLPFWLGVALSGAGFLLWLFVLSRVDLSKAVFFVVVLYLLLMSAIGFALGEARTWTNLLGFALAILGLWLATQGAT